MDQLTQFLVENPHIHYATAHSSDFETLRAGFIINETKTPAVVVRPRSAEDVAALIALLSKSSLPFTVRVGGHDMFGRSQVADGVTIDLREIAHIHVDTESQTARLGGGVICMDMLTELQKHNMTTPHAVTPSVGQVGWASFGGYGMLSSKYGLGVDQIVGATVVDAEGIIREADETMLTGIRGGGGSLGVIVELTIKVYPQDQILAGAIFFHPNDLSKEIIQFNAEWSKAKAGGIPSSLHLYQSIMKGPGGKALALFFMWASSDLEEGQRWLSKVSSWLPVAMSTVGPTTNKDFAVMLNAVIQTHIYGTVFTLNLYDLTPEVLEIIGLYAQKQPNSPHMLFGFHELRPDAPRDPTMDTVFDARCAHFVIEIVPMASSLEVLAEGLVWGQEFYNALRKTNPANILPSTYLSLTPTKDIDMKGIYGSRYETLKRIKEQYDPQNVFKQALPRF
ncbi:uncharacterized protein N7482_001634 [Penicillium canariense]|uniref:FAD-binding PCMH-type domain-containing protein n=1 Tax=Penicillium canariense TaxID=189055 RepID=A0A9W9LUD0_9EURO|nr:uncharacterized protein N7482_001634 [Penicillium canariense]KAJ5175757.1 hypothetical protein N7482_001634 [Penicillium canariense]